MEMQAIPAEEEWKKDGARELVLEVKTEEEAEPEHYSKLKAPSENIYSESLYSGGPLIAKEKQTTGNARLYRAGCFFLTIICLVLVMVVIILSVKLQNGSSACPERQETKQADTQDRSLSPACNIEQCQNQFFIQPKREDLGCQQCANGWLTFGRSCFYLSTTRLSWEESQKNCTSRGGSLAIISSQSVQTFLTKEGKLNYWIGLRHTRDTWAWVNNTVLQQSYWAEDKPTGDCGMLSSGDPPAKNWMKKSCQIYSYFICQLQF